MTINTHDKATAPVQRMVLALNTLIASTAMQALHTFAGQDRAKQREREQADRMKKWHKSAEAARKNLPHSRQVQRRMELKAAKSKRSQAKTQAMRSNRPGGAAAVY